MEQLFPVSGDAAGSNDSDPDSSDEAVSHRVVPRTPLRNLVSTDSAGRTTMRLRGQLDRASVAALDDCLHALLATGARHVVVDVAGAQVATVRLFRLFAKVRTLLAAEEGSFTVVGLRLPELITMLQSAGTDEVFIVYDSIRRESATIRLRRPGRTESRSVRR
jgi:anti-anti-sigma regulatory factor